MSNRRRHLLTGGARGILITPGRLSPLLTLSRSQVSSLSTALGADGATWSEFGADVPRFHGTSRALLIGQQRTNLLSGPRTPGVASQGWTTPTGLVTPVSATGPDGVAGSARLLQEDTATSGHSAGSTVFSVTSGLRYAYSALFLPGTASIVQLATFAAGFGTTQFANFDLTGAGALGTVGAGLVSASIERFGAWYRCTIIADATATVANSGALIVFISSLTDGRGASFAGTSRTLTAAWPQFEQGPAPSTPVLPPVGTTAQSTRGRDNVEGALSGFGIGGNGAGTALFHGSLDAVSTGSAQTIAQFCDNTLNSAVRVFAAAGTAELFVARTTAGVETTASLGGITAGSNFRVGFAHDGAGRVAASLNGGAAVALTGAPTSGYTTLRIGSRTGGAEQMAGRALSVRALPGAMAEDALAAAVAAL